MLQPAREATPRVIAWDQLAGVTMAFKTRAPAKPGGKEPPPLLTACTLRDAAGLAVTVNTTAFISAGLIAGLAVQAEEELAPRVAPALARALEEGRDGTFGTTTIRRDDISLTLSAGARATLLWADIVQVVNYGPGLQLRLLLKPSIVRQGDGWIRQGDLGDLGLFVHHAIARAGVPVTVERVTRRPRRPASTPESARPGQLPAETEQPIE
jgi:hypothetical protein